MIGTIVHLVRVCGVTFFLYCCLTFQSDESSLFVISFQVDVLVDPSEKIFSSLAHDNRLTWRIIYAVRWGDTARHGIVVCSPFF